MSRALLKLILIIAAICLTQTAHAAEPLPGHTCTPGEEDNFQRTGGKEIPTGHLIVCKSGTWRSILSWDAAAAITKIGNLSCTNGQILKFNGTTWGCAADNGGTLPGLTSARIWVGNGSNVATAVTMSGDATLSNAGALSLAANAVANAEMADDAIGIAELSATGTASATTYLRGDNTWATIATGDAPTIDGLDSAQFLRSDADDTTTGRVTSTGGLAASQAMATATGSLGAFQAQSQGSGATAGAAFITFHRPASYAAYFGIDTDNQFKVGGWSMGANAYKVWHAGNDGAASGLDADTVDGLTSTQLQDNLGNHTATTTLALGANALSSSAGTVIDGNGGWHRTYGNTGWYSQTHGGGWNMEDSTWLRAYGGKAVYTSNVVRADSGIRTNQVCDINGANCVAQSAVGGDAGGVPTCKADMTGIQIGATCDDGAKFLGTHPNFSWQGFYVTDANQSTSANWSNAKTICANLSRHGHADWYLPTKTEQLILYDNMAAIGALTAVFYWSSTPHATGNAWGLHFASGGQTQDVTGDVHAVRCVRRQ